MAIKVDTRSTLISAVDDPTILTFFDWPGVRLTTNATTTNSLNTTSAKSSTTTVAASTTIAQQVNATAESIIAVNGSNIGEMINGYRRIFTKQKLECTAGIYDNEFANVYGMVPSGGLTFQNASLTTPTGIISSGIGVGNNLYSITYTEVVAAGNKPFALVQYNLSGNYIMSSKFNGGFGNTYSAVLLNYTQLNSTQDVCRIFGV